MNTKFEIVEGDPISEGPPALDEEEGWWQPGPADAALSEEEGEREQTEGARADSQWRACEGSTSQEDKKMRIEMQVIIDESDR